ncbi:MAG: hypothetical protein R3B45_18215 [Bdellovibrionota bacterium]
MGKDLEDRIEDIEDKLEDFADRIEDSFEKFADTLRLKMHLAKMDFKDSWEKLEKQIDYIRGDLKEFSQEIKQESDEARLKGHLALMDAKVRWEGLREGLGDLIDSVSDGAERKYDNARLQASLAKLEVRELIDKTEYENRFHKIGKSIKDEWYTILSKIDERVVDFINRFPLK